MPYVILLFFICGIGAIVIKNDSFFGVALLILAFALGIYYFFTREKETKEDLSAEKIKNGNANGAGFQRTKKGLISQCGSVLKFVDSSNTSLTISPIYGAVLPVVTKRINSEKFRVENDIATQAYALLLSVSFDLLSSGQYHFYAGSLNGTGEGIQRLFRECLNWLEKHHKISAEQEEKLKSELAENIRTTG